MASSLEYVEWVVDQLSDAGTIISRNMFGEYALYFEGKYFAGVFDNRLLFKVTSAGKELLPGLTTQLPYPGGRPMFYIEDVDDRNLLKDLTLATCAELPAPKPKRRKS